ncbi:hypothetical protein TVAG_163850 [Trichomonas vaginalis G3]|uniref:Uncharacterized protein n=1 Tax=Trichomonas vaginalis (strain ATCC PRA-98 / G3) TaxID=412133 RepID=A2DG62_TRIV3|nr:hypothetical protein TVAGG3_0953960 [Trichomonas vaginalis G3]EAY20689.1 hypothetical protein TVAG_163850 [Trichomonas vaginalis G3]KAI5487409.1 hypothetical protein TVAGG3_0953960 [Trichomonas vaginalis G3]|eukprot:XP_001581675.1 hypothetical protein [Trichomonas vaginalis G3]
MPNHFDSIICIFGDEEEVDKCCQDFEASKIKWDHEDQLCFCQFIDPLPSIVIYTDGERHLKEKRLLTDEEKKIVGEYLDYPSKYWDVECLCQEGHLVRHNKNMAIYSCWTPNVPIARRIFNIFHMKYPKLNISFEGVAEFCPETYVKFLIKADSPVMTIEEINQRHEEERRRKIEEILRMLNYPFFPLATN